MSCTTTSHTTYYDPVQKRKKTKTLAILPNGALIQPSSALLPSIHLQNKIKKLAVLFYIPFFVGPNGTRSEMTIQGAEEAEIADKKMTHRNSPRGHALRRHEQTEFLLQYTHIQYTDKTPHA